MHRLLRAVTPDRFAIDDQGVECQLGTIAFRLRALAAMQGVDDQGTVAMCQASSAFSAARFHGSFIALRPDGAPLPR
ncbi:hypothetical protein AB431_28200 [Mycobacterium sp. EPa45]|nr:hypothetical protein AB431_28200 [Mycobacterium sp. EPa45]